MSGLSGTCNAPLLGVAYCLAVIHRQSTDPATSVSAAGTLTPVNVFPVTLCAVCTVQNVNGDDYENQWLLLFSPKILLSPGLRGRGWVSRLRYDIMTLCMQVSTIGKKLFIVIIIIIYVPLPRQTTSMAPLNEVGYNVE